MLCTSYSGSVCSQFHGYSAADYLGTNALVGHADKKLKSEADYLGTNALVGHADNKNKK